MENTAITLNLSISTIPTLLLTAAKNDIRRYMNGVCIHARAGKVFLISTDGHRVTVYDATRDVEGDIPADGQWIVPTEFLKGIKTGKTTNAKPVRLQVNKTHVQVSFLGATYSAALIEGVFPADSLLVRFLGQNLYTLKADAVRGYLDPEYVYDALKQTQMIMGKKNKPGLIGQGEGEPVIVTYGHAHWVGVIMPMRGFTQAECINMPYLCPVPERSEPCCPAAVSNDAAFETETKERAE